ncbi:MAG TPA: type II toxin-antitoxin system VapC family toxin [Planktothrix sp.]
MNFLLDTNAVIAILKGNPSTVRTRLKEANKKGALIATSSIVMFELWYGVARSDRQPENAERIRVFLSGGIELLPFDEEDAEAAGELRRALELKGKPIGPYNVLIAAQAIRLGMTLVTANVSEFARVPKLLWQDWSTKS